MHHRPRQMSVIAGALMLWGAAPTFGQCEEISKLLPQNGAPEDHFGSAVAINGQFAVIGAPSSPKDPAQPGSVYVYTAQNSVWTLDQELFASDGEPQERFGSSVALTGNIAVIGASADDDHGPQSGSVYVFERQGEEWVEVQKLTASDGAAGAHFGFSLSIKNDVLLVGAWASSALYVFRHDGEQWVEEQKLERPDGSTTEFLGFSVAIDGDVAVGGGVTGDDKGNIWGTAHVFHYNGDDWEHHQQLFVPAIWATGFFGVPVAISGNIIVVGAFLDSEFGIASGSAHVFRRVDDAWQHEHTFHAPDPQPSDVFGRHVAIFRNEVLVGARGSDAPGNNAGAAYLFRHVDGAWTEGQGLFASDGSELDSFGVAVDLHNSGAIVGAPTAGPAGNEVGAAYVFTCDGASVCPADLSGDDEVDVVDLLIVLSSWGESGGPGDVTGDGAVDHFDLLAVLTAWGACP